MQSSHPLFLSLLFVFGALVVGYLVQRLGAGAAGERGEEALRRLSRRIQRLHVLAVNPLILFLTFWAFEVPQTGILSMPLLGAAALFAGGGIALATARRLGLPGPVTGSLFVCGMFSNLGSIGGLICYLFFGEPGFALGQLYRLFEHIIYYAFGFPFANLLGKEGPLRLGAFVRETAKNPLTYVPFVAIAGGILLHLAGVERPAALGRVNALLIPASAGLLMFGIGLILRFRNALAHPRLAATVMAIKFVALPLLMGAAGHLLGYGAMLEGLPLKVTLVQASAPVAFIAMVPATLFGLDEKVAQACWLTSTAAMLGVIPLLYFALAV